MPTEIRGDTGVDKIQSSVAVGKVLQVVTVKDETIVTGTSTLTSEDVTITPTSSSSKILIQFSIALESIPSNSDRGIHTRIYRGSTQIMYQPYEMYMSSDTSQRIGKVTYTMLDSPNTTSAQTYTFTAIGTGGVWGSYE